MATMNTAGATPAATRSQVAIGAAEPNATETDRTRQIIEAAYDLLEQHGLDALTIRAVLARTGLARRAFYERFATKDDLVLALFSETLLNAADFFEDEVVRYPDPLERLKLIVRSVVLGRYAVDHPDAGRDRVGPAMSREHIRLAEARPDDLADAIAPLIEVIAGQLADGMKAGLVRQSDPKRLATLVYNLVATTTHTQLIAEQDRDAVPERRARLADEIWEFCRRAVIADPADLAP